MLGITLGIFFIIIAIVLLILKHIDKKEGHNIFTQKGWTLIISFLLILTPIVIIGFDCVVTVEAGTVGVMNTFGDVSNDEFQPGIRIKNPFTDVIQFSTKTMEIKESSSVPSKEGLIIDLEISVLYKINPTSANDIYKTLGVNYWDVVLVPQLRSITREMTSNYEAKALYMTEGRENITRDIYDVLSPILESRGIILESVLLRDLELPQTVTTAIEMKLKAEQESEQMQFVLQKETQEAQRKRIEAQGIADSQTIIHSSLTQSYLTWYWITHIKDAQAVYYVPVSNNGFPNPIMTIPIGENK